jgi:hypothetical protein
MQSPKFKTFESLSVQDNASDPINNILNVNNDADEELALDLSLKASDLISSINKNEPSLSTSNNKRKKKPVKNDYDKLNEYVNNNIKDTYDDKLIKFNLNSIEDQDDDNLSINNLVIPKLANNEKFESCFVDDQEISNYDNEQEVDLEQASFNDKNDSTNNHQENEDIEGFDLDVNTVQSLFIKNNLPQILKYKDFTSTVSDISKEKNEKITNTKTAISSLLTYQSSKTVKCNSTDIKKVANKSLNFTEPTNNQSSINSSNKKQMRFQCRFCIYKSHSVSLMQNHIYRHIDTTPYSCYYCGHKSTTKSTIMVHIELCHPNMEVKIKESRVKEEDYYIDLNSNNTNSTSQTSQSSVLNSSKTNNSTKSANNSILFSQNRSKNEHLNIKKTHDNKFEIIPNKCHLNNKNNNSSIHTTLLRPLTPILNESKQNQESINASSITSPPLSASSLSMSSPSLSEPSSLCSSPCLSPKQSNIINNKHNGNINNIKSDENDSNLLALNLNNSNINANNELKSSNQSFEGNFILIKVIFLYFFKKMILKEEDKDGNNYVTVFNRPKQYFGSLYEPDKQYSCKLCTYTTNHKPSMEDHVYVHTNKRPYRYFF